MGDYSARYRVHGQPTPEEQLKKELANDLNKFLPEHAIENLIKYIDARLEIFARNHAL